MSYATEDDVAAILLRDLTAAEQTKAAMLLPIADAKILDKVPSVPARLAAATLAAGTVAFVAASLVARGLPAPADGVTSSEESIDDYRRAERRDPAETPGFALTDDEIDLLNPTSTDTAAAGAFTVKPYAVPRPRRALDSIP